VTDLWYAMPVEHAPGYLAATGTATQSAEIFRWQSPAGGALAAPATVNDAALHIHTALAGRAHGRRFRYAQIDAGTGEFAGTTSLTDVDPVQRSVTIGYTWLGQRWWGAGVNAEAKLLLMTYAFDKLGTVRVVWVTDIRNSRAQARSNASARSERVCCASIAAAPTVPGATRSSTRCLTTTGPPRNRRWRPASTN
jgi:hypothetical protein